MRSLIKTTSIIIFLLIYIACVTCPRKISFFGGSSSKSKGKKKIEEEIKEEESEELIRCKNEISYEFFNKEPLDDFLHALLNIKYETVKYDYETQTNEEIFIGYGILEKSAKCYYFELFYTMLEIDLPILPSPYDFCNTEHRNKIDECTGRILAEVRCKANDDGIAILRKLYFRWKMSLDRYSLPGTENFSDLSDEEIRDAISRGADSFYEISEEELFEALSREYNNIYYFHEEKLYEAISGGTSIYPNLKDNDLLQDFYAEFGHGPVDRRPINDRLSRFYHNNLSRFRYGFNDIRPFYSEFVEYVSQLREHRNSYPDDIPDYPGSMEYYTYTTHNHSVPEELFNNKEYKRFLKFIKSEQEYEEEQIKYRKLRDKYLYEARFRRYGISEVSFAYLCKEYNHRKHTPKAFDNLYAIHIRNKIKENCDVSVTNDDEYQSEKISKLKDHTEFCKNYLSNKQIYYLNP